MLERLSIPIGAIWSHLKEVGGLNDPSELTLEDFRLELAELRLLGRAFGPEEYRAALEEHLGIGIRVEELPDAEGGVLAGWLAAEGSLAEVVVEEETGNAVIFVRESLHDSPWPAYELSIFHELSHLAAGHPLRAKRTLRGSGVRNRVRALSQRVARLPPSHPDGGEKDIEELKRNILEPEAQLRAKWLVLAGLCPADFEAELANRLT